MTQVRTAEAVEVARAKINLTLRVHGRRSDGYHELESLVAFAEEGDRLVLRPAAAGTIRLSVVGAFAGEIAGANLVETAWRLLTDRASAAIGADVMLDKRLPVASGIGGGSADAAALLRAASRVFPEAVAQLDLTEIAGWLGADVPICLLSKPAFMTGTGERMVAVALPRLDVVLVNPAAPSPPDKTRQVFAALGAAPLGCVPRSVPPDLKDVGEVVDLIRSLGNDLERPAMRVLPMIGQVKDAVGSSPRCLHAFLSGAGPTIVGLYSSADDAIAAAASIAQGHPSWWVRATSLGT